MIHKISESSIRRLRMAYDIMNNEADASDPYHSVCGLLPAGGDECESLAETVKGLLKVVLGEVDPMNIIEISNQREIT